MFVPPVEGGFTPHVFLPILSLSTTILIDALALCWHFTIVILLCLCFGIDIILEQ